MADRKDLLRVLKHLPLELPRQHGPHAVLHAGEVVKDLRPMGRHEIGNRASPSTPTEHAAPSGNHMGQNTASGGCSSNQWSQGPGEKRKAEQGAMRRADPGDSVGEVLIEVLHAREPAADHMDPRPLAELHGQFMAVVGNSSQEGFEVVRRYEDGFFVHGSMDRKVPRARGPQGALAMQGGAESRSTRTASSGRKFESSGAEPAHQVRSDPA